MVATVFPCGPAGSVNLGSNWTPADLGSALRIWVKADTGINTTGSLINIAADQSGNGFHLVNTGGTRRPTLNATGYNSLPSIDFTAASDMYLATQGLPDTASPKALALGTASSWFFIGRMNAGVAAYGRAMNYLGPTTCAGSGQDYDQADSVVAIVRNASTSAICNNQGDGAARASATVSLNTNMRVLMIFDNTNTTLYINNVQAAQTARSFNLGSSGVLAVGTAMGCGSGSVNPAAGSGWEGTMAEIIVTNTALNSTERNNLDTYVVARLGA